MTVRSFSFPRSTVVVITALVILTPLSLIFWQSFLNAPFFNPAKHLGFDAYRFIFADQHCGHRRAHPRAARLPVLVGGAEESWLRRRGGGAGGRRQSAAGGLECQPADDRAGAVLRRGVGVLPRLRAVRAAAGAG